MSVMQVNYFSLALERSVTLNVILPCDNPSDDDSYAEVKPFKTLYLLNGYYGNYTDWLNYTRIQQWAEEKNLAVVMPSGDNSFYVDSIMGKYGEFVGKELVFMTRRMFPLSHRREDTFIGGLSMGGYGALRTGLKYYMNFGYIAVLSAAMNMFEPGKKAWIDLSYCFGDIESAALTDANPRVAFKNLKDTIKADPTLTMPKIYMACGISDSLIDTSRVYRDFFTAEGVDLTYEESEGAHGWDFWNTQINHIIDWLPLGE